MKWLKHMTCSFSDEKLSSIVDELGLEGYGFWWRLLQVIGENVDENNITSRTFSAKRWGNFFRFSAKKFEKFARIFEEKRLIFVEFSENQITINVPNILKIKDEWSSRNPPENS